MELALLKQLDEARADPHHDREGYARSIRRHLGNRRSSAGRHARCSSFIILQRTATEWWLGHSIVHRTGNAEAYAHSDTHANIHRDSY
jgi:hypothetical protein